MPQGVERVGTRILGDAERTSGNVEDAADFDVVAGGLRVGMGGGAKGGEGEGKREVTGEHGFLSAGE